MGQLPGDPGCQPRFLTHCQLRGSLVGFPELPGAGIPVRRSQGRAPQSWGCAFPWHLAGIACGVFAPTDLLPTEQPPSPSLPCLIPSVGTPGSSHRAPPPPSTSHQGPTFPCHQRRWQKPPHVDNPTAEWEFQHSSILAPSGAPPPGPSPQLSLPPVPCPPRAPEPPSGPFPSRGPVAAEPWLCLAQGCATGWGISHTEQKRKKERALGHVPLGPLPLSAFDVVLRFYGSLLEP